ncbi:MAG TPA: Smr/MutS family protein [Hyphomicrobiaceae bacterium]|nr:Smr/MutS family protein [Hyphomicrobiaceae bacterium]
MSGSGRKRKPDDNRQASGLSKEDRALWDMVVRSVRPTDAKPRVNDADVYRPGNIDSRETLGPRAAKNLPEKIKNRALPGSARPAIPAVGGGPRMVPAMAGFDPKTAKKIKKGRVGIDARIDLHGLRQGEAQAALRRFLFGAAQRGCRTVLVITGKGAAGDETSEWRLVSSVAGGAGRGVLRRNVPIWLAEPDLRSVVVSFASADRRHGGDGAFYVQLRGAGGHARR